MQPALYRICILFSFSRKIVLFRLTYCWITVRQTDTAEWELMVQVINIHLSGSIVRGEQQNSPAYRQIGASCTAIQGICVDLANLQDTMHGTNLYTQTVTDPPTGFPQQLLFWSGGFRNSFYVFSNCNILPADSTGSSFSPNERTAAAPPLHSRVGIVVVEAELRSTFCPGNKITGADKL